MKLKLCFMMILVLWICLPNLYGVDEPENFLKDPGFEEVQPAALGFWGVRNLAVAKVSIDKRDKVEGEQSLYVEVLDPGGPTVGVQQGWGTGSKDFTLEADTKYTLSAWMKSSEPGYVSLRLMATGLGAPNPTVEWGMRRIIVEAEWKEYFLTCTPKEFTEQPNAEFRFGVIEDLWIDQARLYEGDYVPSIGPKGSRTVTSQDRIATTWGDIKELW